ncbi:hypothetical protein [Brevibacillus sp. 179-C9.3 HS]|uniref:hypothetical protein n=1 Tax=unclassified Brevibacillus TaxID=2684853 RepID=UPI00399F3509
MMQPINELYSVDTAPVMVTINNEVILMKDLLLLAEHAYIVYKKWEGNYFKVSYLEILKLTPGELMESLQQILDTDLASLLRDIRRPYFLSEVAINYLVDGFNNLNLTVCLESNRA